MFKKLLIANRGEIACRIITAAKAMGIVCVAIYSDVDKTAKHVDMADTAFCIGRAPSQDSYLRQDALIELALAHNIEAIHPGYGFLAENADFAKKCEQAGIIFIGPSAKAIATMGSKSQAKALMQSIHVPIVPGYHGQDQSDETLLTEAQAIGFPILIKANQGGGGKGMRIVHQQSDFQSELNGVRREAKISFGQSDVLLEKYLTKPRHIEVQIVADQTGTVLHLSNRDCSMQRRQQKIIEEAPAPGLSESLTNEMGEMACHIAKAVDYVGVGTVEFLLDENGQFYFIEMNTRLQVEHAVTEMITGINLVQWQLGIAAGDFLPINQSLVRHEGHAIEVRICAEDPIEDFLPSTGKIRYLATPETSKTIRLDSGVRQGDVISPYYDAMLAKLISVAPTRDEAIVQLINALSQYHIAGIKHNMYFLRNVLLSKPFIQGRLSTQLVEQGLEILVPFEKDLIWPILAMAVMKYHREKQHQTNTDPHSPWQSVSGFRLLGDTRYTVCFEHVFEDEAVQNRVSVTSTAQGVTLTCLDNVDWLPIFIKECDYQPEKSHLSLLIHGEKWQATIAKDDVDYWVFTENAQVHLRLIDGTGSANSEMPKAGCISAPMPGVVVLLHVKVGDVVKANTPLLVLEAMKMEHVIKAPIDGVVTDIYFSVADQVQLGSELVKLGA